MQADGPEAGMGPGCREELSCQLFQSRLNILVRLLVALEILLEMPEKKLFCSPELAAAADFVCTGRPPSAFFCCFLGGLLPFFN